MRENVFKNRNFVLVFLGAAVSNIAAILYNFAVGFWILELMDNNAVVQGSYLAVSGLTFVLLSPFGGVICDRFHKGRIMYICDYLRGAVIIVTGLLILFSSGNLFSTVVLFVAGVIGNIIAAVFSPASMALLPYIIKEDRLIQANSYMSVLSSFQSILGAVLAALLYAAMKPTVLLLVIGVCYVLSGVSEMFIRYDEPRREARHATAFSDIREGLQYVFANRSLAVLTGTIIFVNFFFAPVAQNFFPYFLRTDVAGHDYLFSSFLKPESWNSVFSVFLGVSSILFAMLLSAKRGENEKGKIGKSVSHWLLVLAALLWALTISYLFLVQKSGGLNVFLILMCLGAFLIGMVLTNINIPVNTTIQIITDRDKLGKVGALLNMGSQGLIPVATFLAGIIAQRWGSFALLAACSFGFLAVSLFALCNKSFRSF